MLDFQKYNIKEKTKEKKKKKRKKAIGIIIKQRQPQKTIYSFCFKNGVFSDVYNGLLDSEGEGEGGMIWENGILTCILSCKN